MSDTYTRLKEMLEKQGALSKEDIEKMIAASGEMTAEEITLLEAERHEKERAKTEKVTMEQYLEASKVLDTSAEDSDDYKKALKIVEAYESGM